LTQELGAREDGDVRIFILVLVFPIFLVGRIGFVIAVGTERRVVGIWVISMVEGYTSALRGIDGTLL
jgi:hypothetical protein